MQGRPGSSLSKHDSASEADEDRCGHSCSGRRPETVAPPPGGVSFSHVTRSSSFGSTAVPRHRLAREGRVTLGDKGDVSPVVGGDVAGSAIRGICPVRRPATRSRGPVLMGVWRADMLGHARAGAGRASAASRNVCPVVMTRRLGASSGDAGAVSLSEWQNRCECTRSLRTWAGGCWGSSAGARVRW